MMKITGLSHLFKLENLHNWWLTKYIKNKSLCNFSRKMYYYYLPPPPFLKFTLHTLRQLKIRQMKIHIACIFIFN